MIKGKELFKKNQKKQESNKENQKANKVNLNLEETESYKFLVYFLKDERKAREVITEVISSGQPMIVYLINTGYNQSEIAKAIAEFYNLSYKESIPDVVISDKNGIIDSKGNKYHYLPISNDVIIVPYSVYNSASKKIENIEEVEDVVSFVDNVIRVASTMEITDVLINGMGSIYEISVKKVGGGKERLKVLSGSEGRKIVSSLKARASKFSDVKVNINDQPQSGKIIFANIGVEARLEFLPSIEGESVSIRLFNVSGYFNKRLEDLNYPEEFVKVAKEVAKKDKGLIIIGGATGSGKSTFMKAMILEANPEEKVVRLVEDPVELRLKNITQMQTKEGVFGFADAIRSFMRANPDIIGVGEVRDSETAVACLEAAMSGHLTYTTIHANDSITNLERFILKIVQTGVMSADETQNNLSSALLLSINQKLVRLTNGKVVPVLEWFSPDEEERELLKQGKFIELRRRIREKKRDYYSMFYDLKEKGLIMQEQFLSLTNKGGSIDAVREEELRYSDT